MVFKRMIICISPSTLKLSQRVDQSRRSLVMAAILLSSPKFIGNVVMSGRSLKGAHRTEKMANASAPYFYHRHRDEWAWPTEGLNQERTPLREPIVMSGRGQLNA